MLAQDDVAAVFVDAFESNMAAAVDGMGALFITAEGSGTFAVVVVHGRPAICTGWSPNLGGAECSENVFSNGPDASLGGTSK